jgi:NAD(P)H-hydrate epimerase
MRVLTAEQMQAVDAEAAARIGEIELMRRAGAVIAALIRKIANGNRIVGVAGPGNNGGDVFAAFAELDPSYECIAIDLSPDGGSAARKDARKRALASGITLIPAAEVRGDGILAGANLVLDGLLGVGSRLPLRKEISEWTRRIRSCDYVLSIDVPTGVDVTTGAIDPEAVPATATITIGAPKLGLFLEQARPYVGELWLGDIGILPPEGRGAGDYLTMTEMEAAFRMPVRRADSNKRDSGAPLVIAGSEQFPGAAILCARAAARAGAGYVTVAAPAAAAASLRAHLVEQVVVTYDDQDPRSARMILDLSNHSSAIAIGPGLGLGEAMGQIVRAVIRESTLPIVADASALFHLAKNLDIARGKKIVLTPHAKEFARLSGEGTVPTGVRLQRLRTFLERHGITTLLKGQTTLVDDGTRVYLNPSGTNALATAGTGDVLSGIIATLLSQGVPPFEAASLGAYWHGRAGQMAHADRPVGVVAGDVIQYLGIAVANASTEPGEPIRIF